MIVGICCQSTYRGLRGHLAWSLQDYHHERKNIPKECYYTILVYIIQGHSQNSFPASFPIQVYKNPPNFRSVHHILFFSHPNDKNDLSCLFLFQGSNHCINLFLRMPDAGVLGKMGYIKENDVIQVEEKRRVEQHWFIEFRIHIYIHRICKFKKTKKTTTNQRLLLSLGRNLKQKLWDVEIFNWRLNVQSGSTLHTVDGSEIRRSPPGM